MKKFWLVQLLIGALVFILSVFGIGFGGGLFGMKTILFLPLYMIAALASALYVIYASVKFLKSPKRQDERGKKLDHRRAGKFALVFLALAVLAVLVWIGSFFAPFYFQAAGS